MRLVAQSEEGFAAADLPGGVYGFTSSPALASPLFAARQYRNFEIRGAAFRDAVMALEGATKV